MDDQRVSLEDRLVRAARGTPAFAPLGDDELRAVVRDYLAQQEGFAGRALEQLLDRNANRFREVYELHRRQSTFEGDVAAWQHAHE
jgi:hypothetical protein